MLNLTKSERRAILIVGAVLTLSIIIQWLQPHQQNSETFDYSMQDSLFKALSADTTSALISERLMLVVKKPVAKKPKKVLEKKSININTADIKELEKLPRIGPATAKKILDLRKEKGGFKKKEDLLEVKGIGPKTLEKIRPFIILTEDSPE